jgi:hypothetical protein
MEETSMNVIAGTFGTGEVFWSMLWFFMWFIWIWLLIAVFADIFRSRDMSGWVKALWILFVVVVPYIGVLVYFIARGHKMTDHARQDAEARDAAARQYIQSAVGQGGPSTADELAKLADLKSKGVITDADYDQAKAKILA